MLVLRTVALVLTLLVAIGCGSKKPATSAVTTPAAVVGAGASILVSGAGNVVEIALPSLAQKVVVHVAGGSVFDVAVSPDGQKLAYAQAPTFSAERTDYGSDIYVSERNGSNARLVAKHSFTNEVLRSPAWLVGSKALVFQVQGVTAVNGVPNSRIERVDVTTNDRVVFVASGRAPAATQDGRAVVYLTFEGVTVLDTLWITDAGGAKPRAVLVGSAKLSSFGNASPSPDGSQIALGAAVPAVRGRELGEQPGLLTLGVGVAVTDGLPEDVWLVSVGDGSVRRLAAFAEDLPSFAWSRDGKELYSVGGQGLWQVEVASGRKERLGDGIFHGQVAWGGGR